ncbi:MAG: 16S rRNA (uracil(1498)-N(3))-methyltransferase [Muribaculum sp.]|nr:16S rRNA (uracil(1498)-N(3))-methyltransferase [Muribaculum sp.]
MIQFYAPDIADTLVLPEDDAKHCLRVLRKSVGDEVEVVDGLGLRYTCRLTSDNPRKATVEIVDTVSVPRSWSTEITIAVAPTKNMDRMEWLVEKLTEIGVNRIVPLLCRHSERKEIKIDRLLRIAVAAMKQSLKATLPEIWPMTPFADVIARIKADARYIAYCDKAIPRSLLAKVYNPAATSCVILIGPEGDFDRDEISEALAQGYVPISLGDNRLRTETAALCACDTIHIINQRSK